MSIELIAILLAVTFFILIFVITILLFALWIWMIVDCIQRKFKGENEKIVWILVVVLAGIIGAAVYYFVVKKQDKK